MSLPDPHPTVASAAIATDDPALATSFRFHRPRGALCGRGHCSQCEISTPEGRALACQVPAGAIAERFTPWFYERRFLRPRALSGPALTVLRHVSSAGRLTPLWAPVRP